MAFETVKPMFGNATYYTPQSNFFVDYMYTRIALTNKKNQELARFELDEQATKERGLKDEEIRLRQNITKLQNSLLNREQASISKRRSERKSSAKSDGNHARSAAAQFRERKDIDRRYDESIKVEKDMWLKGQNLLGASKATMAKGGANLLSGIRGNLTRNPNYFDANDGGAQESMFVLWQVASSNGNPSLTGNDKDAGTLFVQIYREILVEHGSAAAESFKTAVYGSQGLKLSSEEFRVPTLGGAGTESVEDLLRLYSKAEHKSLLDGFEENRAQEKAGVPGFADGGSSSSSSSGSSAPALESNVTTDKVNQLIKEYEARLADVMGQREAQEGKRGDILERRLGRKSFAQSMTPFEYVDEDVQSILDEVLGIEDEDVRRETLEESRMMISGARGKIANEFVENQVLNETAIRGQYGFARDRMGSALQEMHQADAAAVSLRGQLKELEESVSRDPESLDLLNPQIESLVANINRQERRALKAEQQHDLYGQINDQLKPLVGSERGVAAEWSAMGPRERLLVIQSLNAGAIGQASVDEDTISTTREEVRLLEQEVRDMESDAGPRTDWELLDNNDAIMAALQELEDNKAALQSLLVAQNQHLTFSGEATGAIDFLVENDPAYRIEPPASRGLGTEAPASAVLTQDEEATMFKAGGVTGKKEGEEEGEKLGEEARRGQAETEARELGVERVGERIDEIAGEPESEAGYEEVEDLAIFLESEEAKLEARPESKDTAEAGDRVTVPEKELEKSDSTYELRTPGEEPNQELVVPGVTSEGGANLGGSQAPQKVKKGRDFREDETFDVAPSPTPEPEEGEESDPPGALGETEEVVQEDFDPGRFEFKSIDTNESKMDPPTKEPGGEPKITADYDKDPELWNEQYDAYIDWTLKDLGDSLVQTFPEPKPKPKPKPKPQPKPVRSRDDDTILSVRASGADPEWLLSILGKGYTHSDQLFEAFQEVSVNRAFTEKLYNLPEETQREFQTVKDEMIKSFYKRKNEHQELFEDSMPEGI